MKIYKPTTPGRRGMSITSYKKKLQKNTPLKSLTRGRKRDKGRNSHGRITTRHRGGGAKRLWREVDFTYTKKGVPARVEALEYDPNRTGYIARVVFADGARKYLLAPQGVSEGDTIETEADAPVKPGNRTELAHIPVGSFVYNIEIRPGSGGKLVRSAGSAAEVIAHVAGYAHLKMPSSEVRKVRDTSWATIGAVSNEEHRLVVIGKAGRKRHMGRRPIVRGSAMNAVDHPHGGGEGKGGRGHRRQRTKWGKPAGKGQRTRDPKKYSNIFILRRRKVGKKRR